MSEVHILISETSILIYNSFSIFIGQTAREHEALMPRNMMSNHTDMQDKYCGDCYDIHPIQSQYTKVADHKIGDAALGRATSLVASFVYWLRIG